MWKTFAFVDEKTTCIEARRMFEKIRGRNKRLSVIFITKTWGAGMSRCSVC